MDKLRAATEENEEMFTSLSQTEASSAPNSTNPNLDTVPKPFVSQFRIDGQPILPPLVSRWMMSICISSGSAIH